MGREHNELGEFALRSRFPPPPKRRHLSFVSTIALPMALPKRIIKVFPVRLHREQTTQFFLWAQETERLLAEPAPGISATPHEDNLRYFDVVIAGPTQSPFEG